ncbi:hypothetical protein [Micromonospora sp. LOL_024]|uniref:hypothetical protein n=1 Tax=Micromonospora sp. LOL_024 TaxID=3345412 RepID=UPI003A84DE5A
MAPARSLHEIITGLTGDAGDPGDLAAVLRASGFTDLPPDLLAEAVVNFADTAPAEIAEHLAPFVMAHGPIAQADTAAGDIGQLSDLLATARTAEPDVGSVPEIDAPVDPDGLDAADLLDEQGHHTEDAPGGLAPVPPDTAFGHGAGAADPVLADELAFDAVAPQAGDIDTPQRSALDEPADGPVPDGDPWATLSILDDTPEIDDIDGT